MNVIVLGKLEHDVSQKPVPTFGIMTLPPEITSISI